MSKEAVINQAEDDDLMMISSDKAAAENWSQSSHFEGGEDDAEVISNTFN